MGRYSTGAMASEQIIRIELPYLIRNRYIEKGYFKQCSLNWTSGDCITVYSNYTNSDKYIRLIYTATNRNTGEKKDFDYKIELTTIPSNLGRGEIIYFVCPQTGRKSRVLYKCYGSEVWKSRYAYKTRIYYHSQLSSRLNVYNDKFWQLEKLIKKLMPTVRKQDYKGKTTRLRKRISMLSDKMDKFDELRWQYLPKAVLKDMAAMRSSAKEFYGF